jgi:NAD(P)-dependent dehydrogenase (short-subunit alcohol dehydrogenase family)
MYTFITGASSGLGEETAKLLSQDRNLLLHGRDEARLSAVGKVCAAHGHHVALFPYELESIEGLAERLTSFLKEQSIQVEAFIHFAGKTEVLPMSKTKYKIGLQVMNVNYFSATEIISTLLKARVNKNSLKSIVMISSMAASIGTTHQPHYCSSKGAVNALTIALARDLAPGIRVNAVTPGSFRTRMWATPLSDIPSESEWKTRSLLSCGNIDAVSKAVRFLLSPDAYYITGTNIYVNGGEHIAFFC